MAGYNTRVYHRQGGAELVVADGGKITIEPGGQIDMEGDLSEVVSFDEDFFAVNDGEVSLKGTAVANIPPVADNLSDSANGAAIAAAVNGNAAAINLIIAALEEFGIALAE